MSASQPPAGLARRLGTVDAVAIGLASMIGAGVFAAFGPAAEAAGAGLLAGLAVAAVIAYCNAVASAQLAAAYPVSGGTYVYGREQLGHWWGFTAGWGFVIGKTASCAAMALTFAAYAVPEPQWLRRVVAVVAVLALAALNYRGVTRTAKVAVVLVALTVTALGVFVGTAVTGEGATPTHLAGWAPTGAGDLYGILQAAGLLFFAFAGYARMATMGEEVRDPGITLKRAIPFALGITVVVYATVGTAALFAVGPAQLAESASPLVEASRDAVAPFVRAGAAVASLGALLALLAGIGRTALAMARERDLPHWLAAVHERTQVPHHAEIALAVVVCVLVLTTDLRNALGFSSFGVLVYYAVANLAAFTQPREQRSYPRALNVLGVVGCVTLAATLPVTAVLAGVGVFAVGLVGRLVVRRLRRSAT
ncbi:MAG: amino acid permease [Streptosporangiales bacterium]|nr:amino acid permease [Streptosporangiales bacterium]